MIWTLAACTFTRMISRFSICPDDLAPGDLNFYPDDFDILHLTPDDLGCMLRVDETLTRRIP